MQVVEDNAEFPRCRKGAVWEGPFVWPLCVDPPRCDPLIGPAMPLTANTSGLIGTYSDLLEEEKTDFRCNETIREIVGGNGNMTANVTETNPTTNITSTVRVFQVTCGEKGIWEAPNDDDWPVCQLLPNKHCSVEQDLNNTIKAGFKLKTASISSVMNNQSLMFVCEQAGFAAVWANGTRVTEFPLVCDDNGEFVKTWPDNCTQYQDCVKASFPDPANNETNGFDIVTNPPQTVISQGSQLQLQCPDGKVMDTGPTVGVTCSGPDTFDAISVSSDTCRDAVTCEAADGIAPPPASGLDCTYTTMQEFNEFTGCTCTDTALTPEGGDGHPSCTKLGWSEPTNWASCIAPVVETNATSNATTNTTRKRREAFEDFEEIEENQYDIALDHTHIRSKRALSQNYIKVMMEVQFASKLPQDRQSIVDSIVNMVNSIEGKFETIEEATWQYKLEKNITDEDMTIYKKPTFDIEIPPDGQTRCEDCIKFILPNTCSNDLLSLLKTGYSHSKPEEWKEVLGKNKDVNEVTVGTSVDLYCTDYIKKPKRDVWDDDKKDGTLTIICMPNLQFNIPYDTSSWGSCLAKCPEPSKITSTADLDVAYDQMTGGSTDELWEGEQIVYRCKNQSLVLNDDPDFVKVKYKCRNTGKYPLPEKITEWPVCTKKPVRPEIKNAIRLMTAKFDMNIDYRNALYGSASGKDTENQTLVRILGITVPGFIIMVIFVILICCCTRPDSIICKICEPSVKEKPGGGSARRRSAKSARGSAKYAPADEEAAVGDIPDADAVSNTDDISSLQTEEEDVPDADTEPLEENDAVDEEDTAENTGETLNEDPVDGENEEPAAEEVEEPVEEDGVDDEMVDMD